MAKYNAFYHVEFYGAILAPRAAWQMDRPSNEVWLTEYFRPMRSTPCITSSTSSNVGHNDLSSTRHTNWQLKPRSRGRETHTWAELQYEINLTPPARYCGLPDVDATLSELLKRNRPNRDMRELHAVSGSGPVRSDRLCESFWCFDCTF